MSYQNPQIPDGVNYSQDHPLKDFFLMLLVVAGSTAALVALLFMLSGYLVSFIPFSTEVALADSLVFAEDNTEGGDVNQAHLPEQKYLQQLAAQLAVAQQLPDDMSITVHYVDDDTVNAFATLGGHIYMHRGLLEKLPHENALAMVMAHEIAHIKHRDPIIAAGRGFTIILALGSILGMGNSDFSQQIVSHTTSLTSLAFSRDQEQQADAEAADTLMQHYGHLSGSAALFEILQQESPVELPEFLSSHPVTNERLQRLNELSRLQSGAVTPLPTALFGVSSQ